LREVKLPSHTKHGGLVGVGSFKCNVLGPRSVACWSRGVAAGVAAAIVDVDVVEIVAVVAAWLLILVFAGPG